MFELLPTGITLNILRTLTAGMMEAGLAIDQINQVRRKLSLVKAGGLAAMAAPGMTIGLILSDVVGDQLEMIASGPTIPDSEGPSEIQALLEEHHLWQSLPKEAKSRLSTAREQTTTIFRPVNLLVGGNETALQASEDLLTSRSYKVGLHTSTMQGEASQVGREFASQVAMLEPGEALLMGGETTVTVQGGGKGGPMQELALSAAIELADGSPRKILGLATDGIDGNSPAAGAIVDQRTAGRLEDQGINPADSLADNDSYTALSAVGAAIETGLTGTNVNDIVVGWCPRAEDD